MKHLYLLVLLSFISIQQLNANSQEFIGRHRAAAQLDSLALKENVRKITEEAKEIIFKEALEKQVQKKFNAISSNNESNGLLNEEGISLEGHWKLDMYGYFYGKRMEIDCYGMLVGSTFLLESNDKMLYPLVGEFDEKTNTLTITKKYVGRDWRGRYFFIYPWVPTGNGGMKPGDIQATFDPATGQLIFRDGDMISWIDYADPEGTQDQYDEMEWYSNITAFRSGDLEKEKPENWESLGYTTFIDGWLMPRFGYDQTRKDNWLHPELLQYKNNKNIYRIKNPFNEEPLRQYNYSNKTGYIEFDVTDPEHVLLNRIDCGWINPDKGVSKMYCYNILGYYIEDYRSRGKVYTVKEFLQAFDPVIPFTTFKNGVLNFNAMLYAGELIYDANFGDANYPTGGNIWVGFNMRTRIYFPGADIKEPEIEFSSKPEVTFNKDNNSADIRIEFEYKNKPDDATIFVMVNDKVSGRNVTRKYINTRFQVNEYSFSIDNIDFEEDYDYTVTVRIEGPLSEVLTNSEKKKLDFASARKALNSTGIGSLYNDHEPQVLYNLQGLKVNNPKKGEIYIKMVDKKAVKVIY